MIAWGVMAGFARLAVIVGFDRRQSLALRLLLVLISIVFIIALIPVATT